MFLTQLELAVIAEALQYRIESEGMGTEEESADAGPNEFTIMGKLHERVLNDCADRIVSQQEYEAWPGDDA